MKIFNVRLRTFILIGLVACLAACLAAGCQNAADQNSASNASNTNSGTNDALKPANPDSPAVNVELKTNPEFVEAGKLISIDLTLKDEKNEVIKDLKITHEKPMHLLVVSQDLQEFYHLHPELDGNGIYTVRHTFPYGGRYTMFLDLTLPDGKQIVKNIGMAVVGKERPKAELKAENLPSVKTVDGLKVEMKADGELAAGKAATLNFTLTDANNAAANKPPADMEKYLGEDAHFVIVSEDVKEFVHAHPMSGDENAQTEHDHAAIDPAPGIAARVTFPKGGLYKIWAQFQRAGKLITVPFVVQVKAGEGETDYSKVEIPKGAIKVTVSKDGFTPKAIEVKAGHPVTLAFLRIDNENCGTEVNFPGLNIKKELPLGKVVTVDIPAEKAGEFNFACGMDMLKGIVMVE